ncbi:conserved hypothetical protein [delta proteobacterium NaphS2]|nr:conserved hypothetical protein [delta proteobacterium NaphS2]
MGQFSIHLGLKEPVFHVVGSLFIFFRRQTDRDAFMEKTILALIKERGPLTGAEIRAEISGDHLALWQACLQCPDLIVRTVGTQYLRLDRRLPGFARLSPSIWRSFLTYSIIGLRERPDPLAEKADQILDHIEAISRSKLDVAFQTVSGLAADLDGMEEEACFIIAGDIVYNMSHDVPRPERSTGKPVNGSDMDMVVVVSDRCSKSSMRRLDEAIYREKFRLLLNPYSREELDYVVKPFSRVKTQIRCDSFRHILACKILHEGTFMFGNARLFQKIKTLLKESGVIKKMQEMEHLAKIGRIKAEALLMKVTPDEITDEILNLFYPSDESEEFE